MNALQDKYNSFCEQKLNINMERGWPSKEQLELSMPLLDTVTSKTDLCQEVDYRAYEGTGGIWPLKHIFGELLEVPDEQIYIGGTMSTGIMYDIVSKGMLFGFDGCKPWKEYEEICFLCPVPGYEKHFNICRTFGIKMIPIPMNDKGPDMDMVEDAVKKDGTIKGIWCVPLYSNPSGAIYSNETIVRLATMKTRAEDFRIFWDNAYFVHHLTDEECKILNIINECERAGNSNRTFEFASTSKITFPGGGVGICTSSKENIDWLLKNSLLQLKSGDKFNQYRHFLFFRDADGVKAHMRKMRNLIKPKFDLIDEILHQEMDYSGLVKWTVPKGGYFVNLELVKVSAQEVYILCKNAGVRITPAGSTFPYGHDASDAHIRLAPTYCKMEELETAMRVLCTSIKLAKDGSTF